MFRRLFMYLLWKVVLMLGFTPKYQKIDTFDINISFWSKLAISSTLLREMVEVEIAEGLLLANPCILFCSNKYIKNTYQSFYWFRVMYRIILAPVDVIHA